MRAIALHESSSTCSGISPQPAAVRVLLGVSGGVLPRKPYMTTEIVIPPQVRAGRALLGWSQEDLARQAGVAITTVRDVEREKRAEMALPVKSCGHYKTVASSLSLDRPPVALGYAWQRTARM
jgi:DNA-binding XRE family transcriptional regulator